MRKQSNDLNLEIPAAECGLLIVRMFTRCSQNNHHKDVHRMFTGCSQDVHKIFTRMFTACSQDVHRAFTRISQEFHKGHLQKKILC